MSLLVGFTVKEVWIDQNSNKWRLQINPNTFSAGIARQRVTTTRYSFFVKFIPPKVLIATDCACVHMCVCVRACMCMCICVLSG